MTTAPLFPNAACDRYDRCSANFCPVDGEREKRTHVDGEPTCHYMLQAAKAGATERFLGGPNENTFRAAMAVVAEPEKLGRSLRKALDRASKQGRRVIPIKPAQRVTSVQSTQEQVRAEAHR